MKKPSARIYRATARNLAFLARRLRAGELVAIPTETVYGLAGNALDARACRQIFRAKGRPSRDPLIVHIHALHELEQIALANPAALKLAAKYWPGPLTFVLPKKPIVPECVTAGRDSVAVRMPAHPVARRLLKLAGIPLAAPSANPFGYISPTTAEHVRQGLGQKIRHILAGGAAEIGLESTIVDLRNPHAPVLLRPGAITKSQLERTLRCGVATPHPSSRASMNPRAGELAPGMLLRHYSPHTRVVLHERIELPHSLRPNEAFVLMRQPARKAANVFCFDAQGRLNGIARRLFATLRKVDAGGFDVMHVELASGGGLADAINDRLRRAAAR